MEIIRKYFPEINSQQEAQLEQLGDLYPEWNQKINVISRKDIDALYLHHVLHSLAVAKSVAFQPRAHVLDLGTGGGFPGIPLAIMFPETNFKLIDARAKKLKVVDDLVQKLALRNVTSQHIRAEELKQKFDFVIARAVAGLEKLYTWSMPLIHHDQKHTLPNGLIAFKGGDIRQELKRLHRNTYYEVINIHEIFEEPYFKEKYLIYIQK